MEGQSITYYCHRDNTRRGSRETSPSFSGFLFSQPDALFGTRLVPDDSRFQLCGDAPCFSKLHMETWTHLEKQRHVPLHGISHFMANFSLRALLFCWWLAPVPQKAAMGVFTNTALFFNIHHMSELQRWRRRLLFGNADWSFSFSLVPFPFLVFILSSPSGVKMDTKWSPALALHISCSSRREPLKAILSLSGRQFKRVLILTPGCVIRGLILGFENNCQTHSQQLC